MAEFKLLLLKYVHRIMRLLGVSRLKMTEDRDFLKLQELSLQEWNSPEDEGLFKKW